MNERRIWDLVGKSSAGRGACEKDDRQKVMEELFDDRYPTVDAKERAIQEFRDKRKEVA